MTPFAAIVPLSVPCKCCGTAAGIFGVVDFNKNCEIKSGIAVLPPAGIPIYYHRCPACSLIFTVAFDGFSKEDFAQHIYNESYALVDPKYADHRPASNAKMILQIFPRSPNRRILDYGGGNGKCAGHLRAAGFFGAETYDPFVAASAVLPAKKFELIVSFEVAEHSPTPLATFTEMASLLADPGVIFFSTMTQPQNIDQVGLSWWYAAPRNGHVTLYSPASLQRIASAIGATHHMLGPGWHLLYRTLPDFARHLIPPP